MRAAADHSVIIEAAMKRTKYLLFATPSLLLMCVVMLYPLCYAFWHSLFSYNLGDTPRFVGLGNYIKVFSDPDFLHSVQVSLVFSVVTVSAEFILGLSVALLLDRITLGKRLLTVLIYLPFVVTPSATGVIFKWLFMPQWGILNQFLKGLSIVPPSWFDNSFWAMVAVIVAEIWQNTPFVVIVLYSGLQSIPVECIEAAEMDGASQGRMLRSIVLPLLRPLVLVIIMMRTMDTWRLFDRIYVMTAGGPGSATETMTLYNFRISFKMLRVGEGLAVGIWTLVFLAIPIITYLRSMKSKEVEQ